MWCGLGFVPNSRDNKAAANPRPTHASVVDRSRDQAQAKASVPNLNRCLGLLQYRHSALEREHIPQKGMQGLLHQG